MQLVVKAITFVRCPKMKRDASVKYCLFFLVKRQHFTQASLFIFGRRTNVTVLACLSGTGSDRWTRKWTPTNLKCQTLPLYHKGIAPAGPKLMPPCPSDRKRGWMHYHLACLSGTGSDRWARKWIPILNVKRYPCITKPLLQLHSNSCHLVLQTGKGGRCMTSISIWNWK